MLTPKFEIDQDTEFLIIRIYAPYIKVSSVETHIDGNIFQFYCQPYFLSLHLPYPLTEDGRERACYDVDSGNFVVYVPKMNSGQVFPDLDMLTKLLTQPNKMPDIKSIVSTPEILVLEEEKLSPTGDSSDEELDWKLEQVIPETIDIVPLGGSCYGFANQKQGVFSRLQDDLPELVSLPDPDRTPHTQRGVLRKSFENLEFDPEHYLADTMEIHHLENIFSFTPSWDKIEKIAKLNEKDKLLLTQLPKKQYLIESPMEYQLLYGLIDIVYAYCYANRSTAGEMDVESAWTIWKLSSTLSWLQSFSSIRSTLVSCLRRSLCYPIYRNFQLSIRVLHDMCSVFEGGKPLILKCLLYTYQLFALSDLFYIHNDLYIKDYCVWIQSVSSKKIGKVYKQLSECSFQKEEIGLELVELEIAALITLEEERRGEEIISVGVKNPEKLIQTDTESDEEVL
ncbi:Protein SHQ1-like [Oopsacas minuta]|uniref:Protein SHQ1 homolog n=1 Tax=Oopsacas minuta TaxID=111878 RepID=A0AAV7JID7_9METZ|nr:Protein SHQ1-like [Oopsacas minuta]